MLNSVLRSLIRNWWLGQIGSYNQGSGRASSEAVLPVEAMRALAACALTLWAGLVCGAQPIPQAAPSPDEVSVRLEKLGNPAARRYPDGSAFHYARSVSDLQAFNGRLYVGHGDIKLNSGPTDIWYYDLRTRAFVRQGEIEDEAADHYRIIDGRLYLPGIDPREDWDLGNFYRLEDDRWVKHRTLPHSVHSSDIIGLRNSLFAPSAREKPPMCLMQSTDDGLTWKMYDAPAGCMRIGQRLIVLGDSVYITAIGTTGDVQMYRFNGNGFDRCRGELLPNAEVPVHDELTSRSWSALEKPTIFKGRIVYIGANHRVNFEEHDLPKAWPHYTTLGLFIASQSGPTDFSAERFQIEDNLSAIAVDDHRCYVVGYRWKNATDPKEGATTSVFASADLKHWSRLFSFDADTFASAIELVGGDFYLGLGGTRQHCTPSTGMILKVGTEQLR